MVREDTNHGREDTNHGRAANYPKILSKVYPIKADLQTLNKLQLQSLKHNTQNQLGRVYMFFC